MDGAETRASRPAAEVSRLRQRVAELEVVCSEQKLADHALRQHNLWLTAANHILETTATEADPTAILAAACRELCLALDMRTAAACLVEGIGSTARTVARFPDQLLRSASHASPSVLDGPVCDEWHTLRAPVAYVLSRDMARPRVTYDRMRQLGIGTLLVLPIIDQNVRACVELTGPERRSLSREQLSLCEQMCLQIGHALSRSVWTRRQHQLSVAVEHATEAVIVCDVSGTITQVNPACEQMSGYTRAELVGQTPRILKSGEQDAAFYRHLWSRIGAGELWSGRMVNRRRDGTCYSVSATIAPLRDENGRTINYVAVQRDVTRELQLEEQYRQAQKMEMLGQLTAGIAHDFNNVLTAVIGYGELLNAQLPPSSSTHDLVGKLVRAGRRGADLVRQLLLFSRKQVNTPQIVNLNQVVGEMDSMLRRIIGEQVQLMTHLEPNLWSVRADPAHIEQIIVNLVVNARDAMPNGGNLCIETANAFLDGNQVGGLMTGHTGEHTLLAVSDTGTGMSAEVKTRLFEPFFTTKGRGKGTGLGLATVHGIVEQYNGNIWVYSEEGIGTTFKIYLPRVAQTAAQSLRIDPGEVVRGGRETILLVEDDPNVRDLTDMMLQEQGYTVLAAEDGQAALRVARDSRAGINLLLSDVVLPDANAGELTEALRLIHPALKVLYMSGYGHDVAARHGVTPSRLSLLQKPFTSHELARHVRDALDRPPAVGPLPDPSTGPSHGWKHPAPRSRTTTGR